MSNNKLEGKVAIITGGASGIGKATACLFAKHGARVVIADIQDELGQQVAASIGSQKCSYIHCDVTDEEQVKGIVEWTVQNHGQLDIMFSNAGIVRSNKGTTSNSNQNILDLDLVPFDHLFAVNARGMAACLGVHGIRVNSVSPFAVATPLICNLTGMKAEEAEKFYEGRMILKGVVVKEKHVADAVLFLASEDSEVVSGHDMVVDA
ncbi:hypothetical protein Gotri_015901, partial [Gossypium trilobum]|nr:hypothetical protein [Gossypium trilobum]